MAHGMRWALAVVVALALSAPAASHRGEEPHYNGWDLDSKFKEIDRKLLGLQTLRELQSRDRSTLRRVLALEATLRDLRTSVNAVELRLRTMEAVLTDLRKKTEAVHVAARPPAGSEPQETPKAAPKPEAPLVEIADEQAAEDSGFLTITGHVRNIAGRPLTFVVVQAAFLDDRGNVIRTESAYTSPRVIGPGDRAAFKIHTRSDRRATRHKLSVQAK